MSLGPVGVAAVFLSGASQASPLELARDETLQVMLGDAGRKLSKMQWHIGGG